MRKLLLPALLQIILVMTLYGCANAINIGSPGEAEKVISVAASTHNDTIAEFSSRGPSRFGYSKPDVTAPGRGNIAARSRGTDLGGDSESPYGEFCTRIAGTSMATPQVAGAAAILIGAYRDRHGSSPPPEYIKAVLMRTSDDISIENFSYDPVHQGSGRINIEEALEMINSDQLAIAINPDVWRAKKLTTHIDRATAFG